MARFENPEIAAVNTLAIYENYKVDDKTTERDRKQLEDLLNPKEETTILPIHRALRNEKGEQLSTIEVITVLYASALLLASSYGFGLNDSSTNDFYKSVTRLLSLSDYLVKHDLNLTEKPDILDKLNILQIAEHSEVQRLLKKDLMSYPNLQSSGVDYNPMTVIFPNNEESLRHLHRARTLGQLANGIKDYRRSNDIQSSNFSRRLQNYVKQNKVLGG